MYAIEYARPKSIADAVTMLGKTGGKALAGGQSLIAAMKLRLAQPGTVVDLGAIPDLKGIRRDGDALVVGAMTCHADVAASEEVRSTLPALAPMAEVIGDLQVRNMGTIGGSIANNDPAADWPAALVALGATVVTNARKISAADFFKGMFETALADDEIITSIRFPLPKQAGYAKFRNPASHFALVGVFVARLADGSVRVAVTGAAPSVFRSKPIEDALTKSFTADAAKAARVPSDGLNRDLHASPEYRAHLVPILASRAVASSS